MHDTTELCLFLSSTFLDMGSEREHLIKRLFPELRQICRERGVTLTEIDLRWGITERQARRGGIVAACLDEIIRRRPFILSIVGDRYGWRPSLNDLNDPNLLARFPWIEESIKENRSLVELETLEIARHDTAMWERIRFYFLRKEYGAGGKNASDDPDECRRLNEFHKRVRESGLPIREGYRTPAQLGEWVREDVLAILDMIAPHNGDVDSWLHRERHGHEAYAITRRRAYIDHESTLEALDRHVEFRPSPELSSDSITVQSGGVRSLPLVVIGESGAGKSALLARWSARYRERVPGAFIIEHYIGSTPSSADRFALMRRVMAEIRERYDLSEELPASPEQIVDAFPLWLARVRDEKLLLVIDALDRLDNRTLSLASFPLDFPPQVVVLLSTTPGLLVSQVKERGWSVLGLTPLGEKDRARAIRAYLSEFSKRLEPEQVRRIASDGKSGNPLYLRTSLEELRIHGAHETLNTQIDHYLSATDPGALFGLVLERIERDFGKGLTASVMSCIWGARSGLSEAELAGIMEVPPLKLHPLIRGMEYHLTRIDGRLDFCHDHLRRAVRDRYLHSRVRRRNLHRRLGAWFSQQPASPRRAEEEPWQWKEGEEWVRLATFLADIDSLFTLLRTQGDIPAHQYRRALPERHRVAYIETLQVKTEEFLSEVAVLPMEKINCLQKIGSFLRETTEYKAAELIIRAVLSYAVTLLGEHHTSVVSLNTQLGAVLQVIGAYREAEEQFRNALRTLELTGETETVVAAEVLDNLASLLHTMRAYSEAEVLMKRALEIRRQLLGSRHPDLVLSITNLGALYYGTGHYGKAEQLMTQALDMSFHVSGEHEQLTAMALNNLATVYRGTGEYEKAIPLLEKALEINESIFGLHHPDTAAFRSNLGYFHLQGGRHEKAEEMYRQTLSTNRTLHGSNHPIVATALVNLGTSLVEQKKLNEAEAVYREALGIRIAVFGDDHLSTHTCWLNIAGVLLDKGDRSNAILIFRRSLPIKENALGRDHPDVVRTYNNLRQQNIDKI